MGGLSSVEWQIDLLREQEIVHVQVTGVADVDSANAMVSEAFSAATKWNCTRFLVDGPDVDFSLGNVEIYDRPEALKDHGILPGRHSLAYVFSGQMDKMRFFENVLRNRGFTARIFSDVESATEWLIGQDP